MKCTRMKKSKRSKLVEVLSTKIIDWAVFIIVAEMFLAQNPTHLDMKISVNPVQLEIESDFASDAPVSEMSE